MAVRTPMRDACLVALASLAIGLIPGCNNNADPPSAGPPPAPPVASGTESNREDAAELRDEIPADALEAVMREHYLGLGHMERYEYGQAAEAFRRIRQLAPGWIPGSINLAIALLNDTGTRAEDARGAGGAQFETNFDEALDLLDKVIERDPGNLHAHYSRGIILEYLGQIGRAHEDFKLVAETDPKDGHAWFKVGSTLTDKDDPTRPAGPSQAKELIEIYTRALEQNPYLVTALFKLQAAASWSGDRDRQAELLKLWRRLNPKQNVAGSGDTAETFYGEMGKYARIVSPFPAPADPADAFKSPRFGEPTPIAITLPDGHRWTTPEDFQGSQAVIGRVRARMGAGVALLDYDGDQQLDLYLTAAIAGPKGIRDALLRNLGDGRFEDVTESVGLPLDRAGLGVAAGDFDADRRIDLYLTGVGDNRLLRNVGGTFEDLTGSAKVGGEPALSLAARWLDLDQDGDLDLYVLNHAKAEHAEAAFLDKAVPGMVNAAYRNDGKPARVGNRPENNWAPIAVAPPDLPATEGLSIDLKPWIDAPDLLGGEHPHTAMTALYLDDDRDLDLILVADGVQPTAILNDRLGRFHAVPFTLPPNEAGQAPIAGLLAVDLDKDGRPDLVTFGPDRRVAAWSNRWTSAGGGGESAWEPIPSAGRNWRSGVVADLDLDTRLDVVALPGAADPPTLIWGRNTGAELEARPLALGPVAQAPQSLVGFSLGDVMGDALPDLVLLAAGQPPSLARNLGNDHRWLSLDLGGRWKTGFDHMRTNPHALGTRLALEGQGLQVPYDHVFAESGTAQSVAPVVLGLGTSEGAPLLRLRWPDGVMQCELNVAADQKLALAEYNRKTGSCPVLFTWNGTRFECLGDFLGGGGLGYLVEPGVYGQPDRDEGVAIAPHQLKPVDGVYRLAISEPMDEIAYMDKVTLEVVDRPPGIEATPDERFAPGGNRPTGELIAWRKSIEPVAATDLTGRDVSAKLRTWDRDTVDDFRRLRGWVGYAEEHGIVLDFGDRLAGFDPTDRLVLCLAGWVEYPYSQTNYAAATAGVPLMPPVLERRRADGTWEVIEPDPGYPAGLPRMTTLDLTGRLSGPGCVLRLRTNMECYWDQAFVAVAESAPGLRTTELPVARARLEYRGYTREVSPDGRLPLLYDHDYVDPAPLARLAGKLTRLGDVATLLRDDDDHLCLIGPGDEVRIEFEASTLPELPAGWTRSFVLRAVGYCKDADPFTAASDTVGPLPWKGMPDYPFPPEGERPIDAGYRDYLDRFQTRTAGSP